MTDCQRVDLLPDDESSSVECIRYVM